MICTAMDTDRCLSRPTKVLLREATQEDAKLIASITRAAWAGAPPDSGGHRETAVGVLEDLQEGGGFILYVDGEPAGAVRWRPADCEPDVWEIRRIAIVPHYRGHRLSLYLVEAVIDRGLESDVEELRLPLPNDQPRLFDLYAACGFDFAPELEYSHANPLGPSPTILRRKVRH